MENTGILSALGAVLFTSDRPVPKERLLYALGEEVATQVDWESTLDALKDSFRVCGIALREVAGGFQLVTEAENSAFVRRFLEAKPFRLGRATLETLAIIAYRQPITRAEIDSIRGIESSHLIRSLIERGLVKMAGKAELPGRPVQYGTTERFLELVGAPDLKQLPPLSELEELQGHAEDKLEEGLTSFIETTSEDQEIFEEDEALTQDIEAMLSEAAIEDDEIYASREHAEAAAENRLALKSFQQLSRRKRSSPTVPEAPSLSP